MKEIIGIIGGNGKMGQAFAGFFEKKGHTVLVSDINTSLSNADVAKKSDILLLSVPIPLFEKIVTDISPHLNEKTLLCDITSLKEKPLESMLSLHSGPVLGLHPMFGPTNMISGQTVVFCSGRGEKEEKRMRELFSDFSCISLSAGDHDKAMALVQGLQHFMEISYGAALKKIGFPLSALLQVASPVYRMQMSLMGRVLSQDEDMYARIVFGSEYSKESIRTFLECAEDIFAGREEKFLMGFRGARDYFGDFCLRAQSETDEFIDLLASRQTPSLEISQDKKITSDIGLLGPEWTWSHLAANHFFPKETKQLFSSFSSVFSALKKGHITKAFLPVENTISGPVREVWEEMVAQKCSIENIYEFPILHVLATPRKEGSISKIFGHAAALAQCKKTLSALSPDATFVAVASNSLAVEQAKLHTDSAAVCSQEAAETRNLFLRRQDIADRKGNATRFALVTSNPPPSSEGTHTSLFFELKNIPGSLLKALQIFSDFHVNMVRLESCPVGGDFLEYGFFADIEGSFTDEMRHVLETVAKDVCILGKYSIVSVTQE